MNGATVALGYVSRTGTELRDEEEDENDGEVKRDEHCMGSFVVVVGVEENYLILTSSTFSRPLPSRSHFAIKV